MITAAIEIETKRLDDVVERGRVDFLKIDIQGGELDVFRNAKRTLIKTAVIHTERRSSLSVRTNRRSARLTSYVDLVNAALKQKRA
jgi:hypothetical protein